MEVNRSTFFDSGTIAVVGISKTRGFGNSVYQTLKHQSRTVYPVSLTADTVDGDRCYKTLTDIPGRIDAVVITIPATGAVQVVDDCIRLGIRKIWLQKGIAPDEAVNRAHANGVEIIANRCALMYAQPGGLHKFHATVNRLFGAY